MSISITVPSDNYDALIRASIMLESLANDLAEQGRVNIDPAEPRAVTPLRPEVDAGLELDLQPQEEVTPEPDIEVDSAGKPWDERIHSSSKAKVKNGTWKLKRGVDPSLVNSIEDKAPTAPPAPPAQDVKPMAFIDLVIAITKGMGDGSIDPAAANSYIKGLGLNSLNDVVERPELIPVIANHFGL